MWKQIKLFLLSFFLVIPAFGSTLLLYAQPLLALTFTPNLAKRDAPGPFSTGVVVQGKLDVTGDPDVLSFTRGDSINGVFYQTEDQNQGSIVVWITPEWNGNDGKTHNLLSTRPYLYKDTVGQLRFMPDGSNSIAGPSINDWIAGNTYLIVVRWDAKNTIDGTNYVSFSINDTHTFAGTATWTPDSAYTKTVGYNGDSLIEGLTIYRRPLYDGTYGVNVGNGDEINLIWGGSIAGSKDPTLITGSWDVVFALPTDSSPGTLTTTGQAWSHPHSSNLLYTNTTNTGGFMMNGTYTNDGWADEPGLNSNLQAFWKLDEANGTREDSLGSNDLSDHNTVTQNIGKVGNAGQFNAVNAEYLSIDDNTALSTGDIDFTISAWVYLDDLNSIHPFVAKDTSSNREYALNYRSDQGRLFSFKIGSGTSNQDVTASSFGIPSISTWYFVVGWHDSSADTINIQVNNGVVDSKPETLTVADTGSTFCIGYDAVQGAYMNGRIDGVGFWKRALTANERTELYNSGNGKDLGAISVSALSTSEKIFAGGYKTTSSEANQGIYYDKTVTAGDDWVVRGLAHSDGTSVPKIILYDQTNNAEIGSLTGMNITGSHDGANDASALTDSTKTWTSNALVGYTIKNITDNSSGTITANTATTITATLAGGTDNNWDTGDTYRIHSTKNNPDVFIFTGEAPTNDTTLRLKLINTQTSGVTYWHQVEVLGNMISNPSAEGEYESEGAGLNIAYQWDGVNLDSGTDTTSKSIQIYHSGTSSQQFTVDGTNEGVTSNSYHNGITGKFYAQGGWYYGRDANSNNTVLISTGDNSGWRNQNNSGNGISGLTAIESWKRASYVVRALNADYPWDTAIVKNPTPTNPTTFNADDLYFFPLTPVSFTLTPASEANSTENTDELRVDGRDTYTASSAEATSIGTTTGFVSFNYRPRHSAADMVKFSETTGDDAYILNLSADANNYVKVFWDSANTLKMEYNLNGSGAVSSTYDATSSITANTEYPVTLSYTGGGNMILNVGGTDRITLNSIPASFSSAPNTVSFGSDSGGSNQGDATFSEIVFDNTAPDLTLDSLTTPTTDTTPTVTGTVTEAIGTVSSVEMVADDSVEGTWEACTAADSAFDEAEEDFSCTLSSPLADGAHTLYLRATDSNGNTTESGDEASVSLTLDTTAPSVPGTPTVNVSSPTNTTTQTWSWTGATDATTGILEYAWRVLNSLAQTVASGTTALTTAVTHLTQGTYTFLVKALDLVSNPSSEAASSSLVINTTAPLISLLHSDTALTDPAPNPPTARATITWTTTTPASSAVEYGEAVTYGATTTEADTNPRVTAHTVTLPSLSLCTVYHFRAMSTDAASNTTTSSDSAFTSAGCPSSPTPSPTPQSSGCSDTPPGSKAPFIYSASPQSPTSILLAFTPADLPFDHYALEYGTSPGGYQYGVLNLGGENSQTFVIDHLTPQTTYYFRLRSVNGCAPGSASNELSAATFSLFSLKETTLTTTLTPDQSPSPLNSLPNSSSCTSPYTVKQGDTLWSIAKTQLGKGSRYPEIVTQNQAAYPALLDNHTLTIGWSLILPCSQAPQPTASNQGLDQTKETNTDTTTPNQALDTPPNNSSPTPDSQNQNIPSQPPTPLLTHNLTVTVRDSHSQPIPNATVTLHSTPQTTTTDNQGKATFTNVENGDHTLTVAYDNYRGSQKLAVSETMSSEVAVGVAVKQISPLLTPPALLTITLLLTIIAFQQYLVWKKRKQS